VIEHASRTAIGQKGAELRPDPIEFRRRTGMGRPVDANLCPTAVGTAEAGQPNPDRAEQGGDLAGSVVLPVTGGSAAWADWSAGGMIAALRGDDCLLSADQKLLALSVRQAQRREIAQITRAVDLQNIATARRAVAPDLHQAQNPPHPWSPAGETYSWSYPPRPNTPRLWTVPGGCAIAGG